MNRQFCLRLLWLLALFVRTALVAQTQPANAMLSELNKQALHREIRSFLQKHHEIPIAPDSPDFGLFAIVGKAARENSSFVDELIDLTAIQEAPPDQPQGTGSMGTTYTGH